MFFAANVLCSLRLFQLKEWKEKRYKQKPSPKSQLKSR